MSIFQEGLSAASVNHIALSPLSFIERTASVYPRYPAVIHGAITRNWDETYQRCADWPLPCRVAGSALAKRSRSCCRTFRQCSKPISVCQ